MPAMANCSHCGGEILDTAKFCQHCGSSESDGWSERALYGDSTSHEQDDFDYEEFIADEFGEQPFKTETRNLWRLVAFVLLILFLTGLAFV